ncbi:thiosulfate sulfurtransferase 18-like isoform X1 [Zingiber officinale]|uniref:thiosulfate sulfurtransferase 18-like isoform X1 n=1 Tax=Zingiber officinale TaxID=94328 RepID=UPI001C4ADF41|nr:thiosulfate sulfurtransferase 18-like isoform X1 [Zingiber officinale]XP_042458163.1 thiosulfate sulfurtransferase 18-like isoform X1 [Zingiber officinale]
MENPKSETDIVTVDGVEARNLVASGHHRYLDVRMEEDFFEKGHLEGALNVPYYSVTPRGRSTTLLNFFGHFLVNFFMVSEKVKNLEFIEQVSSLLRHEEPFIVGCRTGVRAKRATIDLVAVGQLYKDISTLKDTRMLNCKDISSYRSP